MSHGVKPQMAMVGVSFWLSGRCDNSTVKIEKKTYRSKKNVIILGRLSNNNRQPIFSALYLRFLRRQSRRQQPQTVTGSNKKYLPRLSPWQTISWQKRRAKYGRNSCPPSSLLNRPKAFPTFREAWFWVKNQLLKRWKKVRAYLS